MTSAIRFQMFGPFRVWRQGEPIPEDEWPTQKSKSLLKILLNERGHLVPADRLIEALWPDLPLEKARNNLWVTVSQARRVLQPELTRRGASDYILRSAEGYTFNPAADCWLDVDAFRQALQAARSAGSQPARLQGLEAARELYAGAYLEDDPYEDWASARRDELREEYIGLLIDLADTSARLGRYRRAIALCREALTQDSTRETIYQHLMIYHRSAGEHPQALKVFEECRRVLWEELGVEPASATLELYRQIERRQEPVDADNYPPPADALTEALALSVTEFVGRSQEYTRLVGWVEALYLHRGQAALIEGEPGIGKSRLGQEVLQHARGRGLHTLAVTCYRIEQSTPFQPVIELIDQARHMGLERLLANLPAAARSEIRALYPEIASPAAARVDAGSSDPVEPPSGALDEARQARLFKALVELLVNLAGPEGLVLLIDDLHWADQATLRFIHHLARQVYKHPLLLLLTYRDEEVAVNEDLGVFIRSLKREPRVQLVRLGRLAPADVQRILEPIVPAAEAQHNLSLWLHHETDGNPFFLVTILQSLLEQGLLAGENPAACDTLPAGEMTPGSRLALPEALLDSVRDRLGRLPRPAREALEAAAVIGRRFEFATLEKVLQQRTADLLETLDELLRRRLLHENDDGRHYDFSHDKIREVVYRDMSRAHRAHLHRQVAEVIEARSASEEAEYTGTLAEHYVQAGEWARAIYYLGKAGDRSRQLFAIGAALGFYNRAIQLADEHPEAIATANRMRLLAERGETRVQAGEFETAVADLELALEAARQTGDRPHAQALLVTLGVLYRREDMLDRASVILNEALAAARALGDERRVADALYNLGTVVWSLGDNRQAEAYHREAVEISRRLGLTDRVAAQALHGLGEARWISADFIEAYQLFHESMELSRTLGDRGLENENLTNLGALHTDQLVANYRQAKGYLQAALDMLRDTDLPWHRISALFLLGAAAGAMGDYERGIRYIHQSLEQSRQMNSPRYYSTALDFLGCLYRDLNLTEQAEAAFREGLEIARAAGVGFWTPRLQANRAINSLRRGDLSVEPELRESVENSRERHQFIHMAVGLQGLAELAVRSGAYAAALSYTTELAELAAYGMQEALVQAHRWRGEALVGLGVRDDAEAALQQALELAGAIEKPRLAWEIHTALARAYTHWGAPEAADVHRRKAATALTAINRRLRSDSLKVGIETMKEAAIV